MYMGTIVLGFAGCAMANPDFGRSVKGAFNTFVDKVGGGGSKNVCFCPRSGYKKRIS